MADTIKVNPTPIQRNIFDVAVELTQLYYKSATPADLKEMQEVYAKFYAIALIMQGKNQSALGDLIPDELLKKITK